MITDSQAIEVAVALTNGAYYLRAAVTWADDASVSGWSAPIQITVDIPAE